MISKHAHSIKNPHIIHFIKNNHYVCMGACSTTPSKSTQNVSEVTCKNCLHIICTVKRI